MSLVLQVSDPHFGTEQPAVMAALERLSAELKPDVLVLSGDITQRARRAQFDAAAAFVQRLGIAQKLVIPGNHDVPLFNLPMRLLAPYRGFRRVFGTELDPLLQTDELLLIGVRTTRRWRHKHGQVSAEQIERVSTLLREAPQNTLKMVVTHQPLDVVSSVDRNNLLRGHEPALKAWLAAGADMLLAGHIHLPHMRTLGTNNQTLPMAVQAGTALSNRLRSNAPNSVNVIRHERSTRTLRGSVQRYEYHGGDDCFLPTEGLYYSRALPRV
jgi:3',5'-cyclic AMP phosphodiesterase CpdA